MLTSQVSAKLLLQFMIYLEDQQSLVLRRLKDTHFIPVYGISSIRKLSKAFLSLTPLFGVVFV